MMVYEQITFFIKIKKISNFVFELKIDFVIGKSIYGLNNPKKHGETFNKLEK